MSNAYIGEKKTRTLAIIVNNIINIRIWSSSAYNHLRIIFSIEADAIDAFVTFMASKRKGKTAISNKMQIQHQRI